MFKLLLLFLLGCQIGFAQQIQTIRATTPAVDIRVGDDFFIKAGWRLEPHKNPDIFSIGSKWDYETLRVKFITDVDSIFFDVRPGSKHDFIVLWNDTPCRIQIVALPTPVFMDLKVIVPLLIAGAFILLFVILKPNAIPTSLLLRLGYVAPLLFLFANVIGGFIHGNYNHKKNVVSELGALGTSSEVFISTTFAALALLNTLFLLGFYRASKSLKISTAPAVLSFGKPIALLWAAIFPLGNEFHSLTGPLPFLVALGALLAFALWRERKDLFQIRYISLVSFFIMMLILVRFLKPFGQDFEGLIQRVVYLGWATWMVGLSYFLGKMMRNHAHG